MRRGGTGGGPMEAEAEGEGAGEAPGGEASGVRLERVNVNAELCRAGGVW
jgi:hypothetical protein